MGMGSSLLDYGPTSGVTSMGMGGTGKNRGFFSGIGDFFNSPFMSGPGGMALMSFGLPLLGNLFGGGSAQQKAFKEWKSQYDRLMSPRFMYDQIGKYQPLMNQMSQGDRASILTNANAFQGNLSRNLASSGMNRTGIGALAATAGSSVAANQLLDLSSQNRRNSMALALSDRNHIAQMLSMGPQYMDSRWLNSIAEGSDTFMQYMLDRQRPQQTYGYR